MIEIRGQQALERRLLQIARRAPERGAAALEAEAELIMGDSKENYVPAAPDGGTLRGSGFVAPPEINGNDISVTMGYGGDAAAYAEAIHEHPSGASPPSWKGKTLKFHPRAAALGQKPQEGVDRRKYLEKPLMKAKAGLGARIARRVNVEDM